MLFRVSRDEGCVVAPLVVLCGIQRREELPVSHATALAILFTAICLEVTGTAALQASQQFTRLWPTLLMACCYAGSLFLLSVTLKAMPVGIAYAIWSGVGIVLIAIIGYAYFGQALDMPAVIGLALIVAGVVVVNVFSNTIMH